MAPRPAKEHVQAVGEERNAYAPAETSRLSQLFSRRRIIIVAIACSLLGLDFWSSRDIEAKFQQNRNLVDNFEKQFSSGSGNKKEEQHFGNRKRLKRLRWGATVAAGTNSYRQLGVGTTKNRAKCPAGYFASTEGSSNCQPCPAGRFKAEKASTLVTSCTNCSAGYFARSEGSSKCYICRTNQYSKHAGMSQCKSCPNGTESIINHTNCFIPNRFKVLRAQLLGSAPAMMAYTGGVVVTRVMVVVRVRNGRRAVPTMFDERVAFMHRGSRSRIWKRYFLRTCGLQPVRFHWTIILTWDVVDWLCFLAWFLKGEVPDGSSDAFLHDFFIVQLCCNLLAVGICLPLLMFIVPRYIYNVAAVIYDALQFMIITYAQMVYQITMGSIGWTLLIYFANGGDVLVLKGPEALDDLLESSSVRPLVNWLDPEGAECQETVLLEPVEEGGKTLKVQEIVGLVAGDVLNIDGQGANADQKGFTIETIHGNSISLVAGVDRKYPEGSLVHRVESVWEKQADELETQYRSFQAARREALDRPKDEDLAERPKSEKTQQPCKICVGTGRTRCFFKCASCQGSGQAGIGGEQAEEAKKASFRILFFGNPGSGKSSLANCLASEQLFASGMGRGEGLTKAYEQMTDSRGRTYTDLPGLSDARRRPEAARECTKALREGGPCKVFMVLTECSGRIRPEDRTTMSLISQAAEDIGNDYGVIINRCGPGLMEYKRNIEWKKEFERVLLQDVPHVTSHIFYLPRLPELDDKKNAIVELGDKFRDFIASVPVVSIDPGRVTEVNPDTYEDLLQKNQAMTNQQKLDAISDRLDEETMLMNRLRQDQLKEAECTTVMLLAVLLAVIVACVVAVVLHVVDPSQTILVAVRGKNIQIEVWPSVFFAIFSVHKVISTIKMWFNRPKSEHNEFEFFGRHLLYWRVDVNGRSCYFRGHVMRVYHIWLVTQVIDAISDVRTLKKLSDDTTNHWIALLWAFTTVVSVGVPLLRMFNMLGVDKAVVVIFCGEDVIQTVLGFGIFEGFRKTLPITLLFSLLFAVLGFIEGLGNVIWRLRHDDDGIGEYTAIQVDEI